MFVRAPLNRYAKCVAFRIPHMIMTVNLSVWCARKTIPPAPHSVRNATNQSRSLHPCFLRKTQLPSLDQARCRKTIKEDAHQVPRNARNAAAAAEVAADAATAAEAKAFTQTTAAGQALEIR
ncbi:hypothetical protein HPB50_004122 [Hyalomma asiaticum]|uniref:Uncharacterized protein n=1 Tax=Hyalomma asiaticum TaxID=266040 RepID=A0ACB7SEC3_HYAAI|nr:hypothetical protein HPB50_004122 [Hyalomma asiaticum]